MRPTIRCFDKLSFIPGDLEGYVLIHTQGCTHAQGRPEMAPVNYSFMADFEAVYKQKVKIRDFLTAWT